VTFQTIEVEATFAIDGWPNPSALYWAGEALTVVDVGRRWKDEDGIHMLARVQDERVFELHTNGSVWRGRVISEPPHTA